MSIHALRAVMALTVMLSSAAAFGGGKVTAKPSPSPTGAKIIAGWLERVTLTAADRVVKAKLDSGAKTSSIHATDIEEIQRDGKHWVRFKFSDTRDPKAAPVTVEARRVRYVRIKDHDDPSARRPIVELEICLDGRRYKPQFTLANRSNFLYPILLGRRFLAGVVVIDPADKYLTSPKCPEPDAANP